MLTIVYSTSRKDPKLEWFLDSLNMYCLACLEGVKIIVVDFHCQASCMESRKGIGYLRIPPKPTVWQGPSRLTKRDFFAPSNARNTGLCYAPDGWIAFVDDLSVLMPGWLDCVREAISGNYVVCGRYQKVKNLVVENGVPISYEPFDHGLDTRMHWMVGKGERGMSPRSTGGEWLFGCSFAAPVEAMLTVGGFPEIADGLGGEDYMTGIALERQGYTIKYDPRMMTLESEELHYAEPPMIRYDKGKSPNDKSHAALKMVHNGMKYFENYHPGGIRALRQHILAGGEFPPCSIPQHDWFDQMPLIEM